jgi:hypothetical protein
MSDLLKSLVRESQKQTILYRLGWVITLSLSLSLSHTHTHTHTTLDDKKFLTLIIHVPNATPRETSGDQSHEFSVSYNFTRSLKF